MSTYTPFAPMVAVVTTITVVIGVTISYVAFRAARREASRALRLFSYGFGAITLGIFVGGASGLVLGLDATTSLFVQGVLVAPGFVLLLRSLYSLPHSVHG